MRLIVKSISFKVLNVEPLTLPYLASWQKRSEVKNLGYIQ